MYALATKQLSLSVASSCHIGSIGILILGKANFGYAFDRF